MPEAPTPQPEIRKPTIPDKVKTKVREWTGAGIDWLRNLRGRSDTEPREVIEEVATAPEIKTQLVDNETPDDSTKVTLPENPESNANISDRQLHQEQAKVIADRGLRYITANVFIDDKTHTVIQFPTGIDSLNRNLANTNIKASILQKAEGIGFPKFIGRTAGGGLEMEYIPGKSLKELIVSGKSLTDEQIKEALALHKKMCEKIGRAHGDLLFVVNPDQAELNRDNIRITPEDKVRFIDPFTSADLSPEDENRFLARELARLSKKEDVQVSEATCSRNFFPEAVQQKIDLELQRLQGVQRKLQELKGRIIANKDTINPAVEKMKEIETAIANREREKATQPQQEEGKSGSVDLEEVELRMAKAFSSVEISEYYDALAKCNVAWYDRDLQCDELIEAESTALILQSECRRMLGQETEPLSTNHLQEQRIALREQIQGEQEYINGENIMSHVTGCRALVDVLRNGNLAAREENQIVFDRFTARASYATGKDKVGRNREDPVIVMTRSRDLMTEYQYMDSDGRHFWGRNHNEAAGQYDPFSAEATKGNMAILVPSVYREDLIADLSEVAKAQGKAVQELFDERGVVFVEQSDYTIAGGDYKGNIFYGNTSKTDENGREDRKVVEHLIQIGRSRLYDRPLPQIKGRIVPTGNTGEGAGGGKGKLYNFKKSGQEPE